MEILFFLIFIGVIIAVAVSKHSKTLNETWEKAARSLDLRYTAGSERSLRGKRPAMKLLIDAKSAGKSRWTDYTATFTKSLPIDIKMKPQGLFSEISHSFFNRVDIEIGDPLFDSGVIVEGVNPDEVRKYLDQNVVAAIKGLIAQFDSFEITQQRVAGKRNKIVSNAKLLIRDIEVLEKAARVLSAKGEVKEEAPARTPPPIPKRVKSEKPALTPPSLPCKERSKETEVSTMETEAVAGAEPLTEPEVVAEIDNDVQEEEPPVPVPEPSSAMEDLEIEEKPDLSEKSPACLVVQSWLADFSEGTSHYDFVQTFENRWKGSEVSGAATLRSVESYSMDRIFGRGPGVRLFFELGDLEDGDSLTLIANAKTGISIKDFRSRIGQEIPFEGTLIRCDSFEHVLFLQASSDKEAALSTSYASSYSTYSPSPTVLSSTVSSESSR